MKTLMLVGLILFSTSGCAALLAIQGAVSMTSAIVTIVRWRSEQKPDNQKVPPVLDDERPEGSPEWP